MRKLIIQIIKTIIAGMISLCILSLWVYCFSFSGVHITNPTGATDYMWEPMQRKATTSEGFAWLNMDKYGFNNSYKFSIDEVDNLVLGSSHTEAVNVNEDENFVYLMNKYLPDMNSYNIGMSGHTIYTCVSNMQSAVDTYKPNDYVILETDTVELSIDSMNDVLEGNYSEIISYDTGIVFQLQKKFPIVKSIYKTVEDWKNADRKEVSDYSLTDYSNKIYKNTLACFCKRARTAASSYGAKLIVVYHPTADIDEKGNVVNSVDADTLEIFSKICIQNDIIFVDMTNYFEKLYEDKHILVHGFINTGVGQGHLNKYGHKAIAEILANMIKMDMEKK